MVITRNGVINRQRIDEIRVIGRATQGVRLVNLDENDSVMDVARVIPDDSADDSAEASAEDSVEASADDSTVDPAEDSSETGGTADGEEAKASLDAGTEDAVGMDPDTAGE
jgi:DNA gyrase subunit A